MSRYQGQMFLATREALTGVVNSKDGSHHGLLQNIQKRNQKIIDELARRLREAFGG